MLIVKDERERVAALDTPRQDATSAAGRSEALKVDVLVADLARPASVAMCCARIRKEYPRVDVLINCAGAASDSRVEVDGLELQFATNVLGSFVLMRELLPAMPRGGRVVLVASELANGLNLEDLQSRKLDPYDPKTVYAATKQAIRMLAAEAPKHEFASAGVVVTACHPGVVTSELLRTLGIATGPIRAEMAAQTPLKLALGPAPETGTYHVNKKPHGCKFAKDTPKDVCAREELWQRCEELASKHIVGPKLSA